MVPIGAVLAGKYRVERVLGQGGMGVVVQATHLQLGQPVALKFLLPEVLGNPDIVARFLREAQAAVRLKSEHVARVIDVGTLDTGAPYMVLEYLDGVDLAHVDRRHLSPGLIVDFLLQACEGLAEAHALGIVHRDVKPGNFFLARRNDGSTQLKVLDFGISKSPVGLEGSLTATQAVMGTPAYMSPEQMRSAKAVDARSDIWALGAVLYELLQGAPPFEADSFAAMCVKVAMDPHGPLTVPLPPGLAEVVYRCLDKDPARRFQNVAELAAALAPFAQSPAQAALAVERAARMLGAHLAPPFASVTAGGPSTFTAGASAGTVPPPSRARTGLVAGVIVAVVAAAVVAVVALGGGKAPASAPGGAPTRAIDAGAPVVDAAPAIDAGAPVVDAAPPIDANAIDASPIDAGRARQGSGKGNGSGRGSGKGKGSGAGEDVLDSRY
jgi:eukaryotic-like serine/threonine-protein kinase